MHITKAILREFVRNRGFAVISTVAENGAPEAALVNIAASEELELIFHTIQTTRKCVNLRRDARIAAVIGGWDGERTLQFEGISDEPEHRELERLKTIYREMCPSAAGRDGWPGLTYFRVRPKWVRFSNYDRPWSVQDLTFS
jgi:general stress protein 26